MNTNNIKKYLVALIVLLIIDLTWLLVIMREFYENQFSQFLRPEIVPIWSALLAWALIPLGIVIFVDQLAKNKTQSLFYGALYGLILYGVYDFTNFATLAGYSLQLLIVDIIWGTFLCSVSAFILKIISNKLIK